MDDPSDQRRRPIRRRIGSKRGSKKSSSQFSLFVGAAIGMTVVGVVVVLLFSRGSGGAASGPTISEIIAAGPKFEEQHQADRQLFPISPAWLPLNHTNRKFNVRLPVPFIRSSTQTGAASNFSSISTETYVASLGESTLNVEVGRLESQTGMTTSDLMNSFDNASVMKLSNVSQVTVNRVTTWKGQPCREFELIRGGKREFAKFIILSPEDCVVLSFLCSGSPPEDQMNRFFDSFSLEGDPEKYGSPKGWPTSSDLVLKEMPTQIPRLVGDKNPLPPLAFQREMDRSRWLEIDVPPKDVLANVDVFRDANFGNWYHFQKGIVSPAKTSMLVLPVEPVDRYELNLEVCRVSHQPESFNIGLIVGGRPAMIVVDGFGGNKTCLSPLDGKVGHELSTVHNGTLLSHKPAAITVQVTPNSVQMTVNGAAVIDFKGDSSRLGLDRRYWFPPPNALFLSTWETQYYVSKCEVRRL